MSHAIRSTPETMTYEEYLVMPLMRARHEVIDGVIVMSPAPTVGHQWILKTILRLLDNFVEAHELGTLLFAPLDILIRRQPTLRTRQPDIVFFSAQRISGHEIVRMKIVDVAPDLAVEIRSEEEKESHWSEKLTDYAEIGVSEVWRVLPESRSVVVLRLAGGVYERAGTFGPDAQLETPLLPGLVVPVASIYVPPRV